MRSNRVVRNLHFVKDSNDNYFQVVAILAQAQVSTAVATPDAGFSQVAGSHVLGGRLDPRGVDGPAAAGVRRLGVLDKRIARRRCRRDSDRGPRGRGTNVKIKSRNFEIKKS